jgi:hypothetical protein
VYIATCGFVVAVTWPETSTVMAVELVFVGSFRLLVVTVILVFWVTAGAVKFPVESTVAPEPAGTDQTTSVGPSESAAVSWIDCVEKTSALVGVTASVTGTGGLEVELQPAKKITTVANTRIPRGIRFIIHPKWEVEAGAASL